MENYPTAFKNWPSAKVNFNLKLLNNDSKLRHLSGPLCLCGLLPSFPPSLTLLYC